MPENFQQTVDLREPAEKQRRPLKKTVTPLLKILEPAEPGGPGKDFRKISQPRAGQPRPGLIKPLVFILAILAVGAAVYFLFFRAKSAGQEPLAGGWYAVKLVNGEIFYGQIADLGADPVTIANVYYNYDYEKDKPAASEDKNKTAVETGNLRLVKRGKETHGPDGSLKVVRAQVLYMEALKSDSKVLKAILEYEK